MLQTRHFLRALMGLFALSAPIVPAQEAEMPVFNQIVLDIAETYPTDGTHGYWWPSSGAGGFDGCSKDMFINGEKVMDGEEEGRTHCSGLTLEVFVETYNRWAEERGVPEDIALSRENFRDFQRSWFVREVNGPGPSIALEEYGLGVTVPHDEALPGDFIQIWRENGYGHTAVFKEWERDVEGTITGLHYWSSQKLTDGIGDRFEQVYPVDLEDGIHLEHTHIGRVQIPEAAEEGPASAPTSQPTA